MVETVILLYLQIKAVRSFFVRLREITHLIDVPLPILFFFFFFNGRYDSFFFFLVVFLVLFLFLSSNRVAIVSHSHRLIAPPRIANRAALSRLLET